MNWLDLALPLIKEFEGCRLEAYPDPASGGDPWTIGWGATGPGIREGVTWTRAQADERLAADVARFGRGVEALVTAPVRPHQMAAMVSLAYNIGLANFGVSTLLKMVNAGDSRAVGQFGRWNRARGRIMAGLTRRRAAEAKLFQGD